jgi:hypothetical protein
MITREWGVVFLAFRLTLPRAASGTASRATFSRPTGSEGRAYLNATEATEFRKVTKRSPAAFMSAATHRFPVLWYTAFGEPTIETAESLIS